MVTLSASSNERRRRKTAAASNSNLMSSTFMPAKISITTEYRSFFFAVLVAWLGIIGAQRAAKLHGAEAEAIAQEVGGARQFFEFGAAFRGQQIELLRAVRQTAEAYTEKADFAAMVAVLAKKIL